MPSIQQPSAATVIASRLPAARFEPYLAAAGSTAAGMRLYRWNIEMTGALHESLGVVEVALRNTIDRQLQAWNPTRSRSTGQTYGPNWVENPAPPLLQLLRPVENPRKWTYTSARDRAQKDADARDCTHPRARHAPNHDDVVAHMTFGTWIHLLPRKKDNSVDGFGPGAQRGLWKHALKDAFPHQPDPLVIHQWASRLHLLRNRVAHLEPLIDTDVMSYHKSAARLLRAIDPVVGDWYAGTSRVPTVYKNRP